MTNFGVQSAPGLGGRPVRGFGIAGILQDILSSQHGQQGTLPPGALQDDDLLTLHDIPTNGDAPPGYSVDTITRILRRMGMLDTGYARKAVNTYQVQQAQAEANARGLQTQLDATPGIDPNAAAYTWQDLPNAPMPVRQQVEIPTRPAPGSDRLSQGLALLAGLLDPKGAGNYNAAPLQAAIGVADQQYGDALTHMQLAQEQADQQYQDLLRKRDADLQNAIYNRQGARAASEKLLSDQRADALLRAGIRGSLASQEAMVGSLGNLSASQRDADAQLARRTTLAALIPVLDKQSEFANQLWLSQSSPQAMAALEEFRQRIALLKEQLIALQRNNTFNAKLPADIDILKTLAGLEALEKQLEIKFPWMPKVRSLLTGGGAQYSPPQPLATPAPASASPSSGQSRRSPTSGTTNPHK